MKRLVRKGGVGVIVATLLVGGMVGTSSAQIVGTPDVVGQWTDPFEEGGAGVPRCVPANDGSGFVVCKPAAQASAMLPDGRIMYWNGIESQENARGPSALSLSPSARDSQSRVLDLSTGTPNWIVPSPERGAHESPDVKQGQGMDDNLGAIKHPQGRPGDGFLGSTWGKLGGPESYPVAPPDDSSSTRKNSGDMFCADVTSLADGRILIAGGTDWYNEPRLLDRDKGDPADVGVVELQGLRSSSTFNFLDNTFTPTQPMKFGRWYPGMVVQPDGSVLVFSGAYQMTNKLQGGQVRRVEKFDPATNAWTEQFSGDTSENSLPMQPRMFLVPSGKTFYTGVGQMWGPFGQAYDEVTMSFQQLWDPEAKTWSITGIGPLGARSGTQVVPQLMSPPYDQLNLVTFGGTLGPPPGNWIPANPFTTVTTIDANDNVSNRMVGNLHHARWFPSSVLLPDGKIVAVGGGDKDEVVDPGSEIAVKVAEVYDPDTGQWTEVASHTRDRTYHNSALLLPDMRLLLGGHAPIATHYGGAQADQGGPFANNDKDASFEVWSPPYLFRGARPSINHVQPGIGYGETFSLGTPNADEIESVLLLRTPTPQHVNDSDQRGLILASSKSGPGTLKVTAPPSGKVAPPGAYYLVVNKRTPQGPVPSVARIVKVGESITAGEALQPFADDNPAAPKGGSATPDEDTSSAASTSQRASEAAEAAPAPVGAPAAAATQTAYQAYTELNAVPASNTKPFSPVLPAAAVGAVGVAVLTGRRWLLSRI
jgi:hypothetical protein